MTIDFDVKVFVATKEERLRVDDPAVLDPEILLSDLVVPQEVAVAEDFDLVGHAHFLGRHDFLNF